MTYTDRLHKVSIFEGLTEAQILKIEELAVEEEFAKGDYMFRQGETAEWLYILLKGRVKLIRHAPTGAATIIEIYSVGDELTAAALIEGKPYAASAKSLTDGLAIKVSQSNFKKMLGEWPVIAGNIMREMGSRYRELMENLSSLAVYKVEGRLCKVMANLARRYGIFGDCRGVILDLALTRQDLADITGTTLETTIRTLNRLKGDGLITWEGKRFFIPDVGALEGVVLAS
ncbi:MAG: Crp/Fnr family transcriptional regulator [Deltaproteobacteria bacterium]|nr:Crp/Fnr family transcriptional regulator [Deltaproteobacteria bacterium]